MLAVCPARARDLRQRHLPCQEQNHSRVAEGDKLRPFRMKNKYGPIGQRQSSMTLPLFKCKKSLVMVGDIELSARYLDSGVRGNDKLLLCLK